MFSKVDSMKVSYRNARLKESKFSFFFNCRTSQDLYYDNTDSEAPRG